MDVLETDDPRGLINVRALVEALENHALGGDKMSATQVSAAIALLKKTLPDLPGPKRRPAAEDDKNPKAHEEALKELV